MRALPAVRLGVTRRTTQKSAPLVNSLNRLERQRFFFPAALAGTQVRQSVFEPFSSRRKTADPTLNGTPSGASFSGFCISGGTARGCAAWWRAQCARRRA